MGSTRVEYGSSFSLQSSEGSFKDSAHQSDWGPKGPSESADFSNPKEVYVWSLHPR